VIPIDTEAARRLARRHVRFRWLVAALVAAWAALLVPTLLFTPLPPLGPFAALAVLVILAEHRFVLFGDETSMSASIIVIVASVFIFADTSPLAGPMLIGSLGGLYLPHLRHGNQPKIAFNSSVIGIAAWGASASALGIRGLEQSAFGALFTTFTAVLIYWVVNNLLVATHQAAVSGYSYIPSAWVLTSSDTDILAWTAATCIGVTALHNDPTAALALVAGVVACRVASLTQLVAPLRCQTDLGSSEDSLVVWLAAMGLAISSGTASPSRIALGIAVAWFLPRHPSHSSRFVAAGLPIIALSTLGSSLVGIVAVLLTTLALLLLTANKPGSWTACISAGATVAALIECLAFRNGDERSALLLITAVALSPAVATILFAFRYSLTAKRPDALTALGIAAPSPAEIAALGVVIAASYLAQSQPAPVLLAGTLVLTLRVAMRSTVQRTSGIASR
jgi:hypothetical protein